MWAFLTSLLAAIPQAVTSREALAAYGIAALAYVLTMWRVARNKNLLAHLRSLPPKDRLSVLEMEMGGVRLSSGISPEQWVRSRIHKYYLIAFAISALLALCLVWLALAYRTGTVDVDVGLDQHSALKPPIDREKSSLFISTAHSAEAVFVDPSNHSRPTPGSTIDLPVPERTLKYRYSKDERRIKITPDLPYLTKVRGGEPIKGFSWYLAPFQWDFPSLAIKVVNNTRRTLLLTEVVVRVRESSLDNRPLLVVRSPTHDGRGFIWNEGWGPVVNPRLQVSLKRPGSCDRFSLDDPVDVKLESFDTNASFSITPYVPDSWYDEIRTCASKVHEICLGQRCRYLGSQGLACLDSKPRELCEQVDSPPSNDTLRRLFPEAIPPSSDNSPTFTYRRSCWRTVCVHGQLNFKDDRGKADLFRFTSTIVLDAPGASAPLPPSFTYDLFLEAGKSRYEQRKSISQEIKPGDADHFLLRVATDRSASFDFSMHIVAAGGTVVWDGDFEMTLLRPRTAPGRVVDRTQQGPAQPRR